MHKAIVKVPFVDLCNIPFSLLPHDFSHQKVRESQLLFNEPLTVLEEQEEWVKVAVHEQLRFQSDLGWHPYEGWLPSAAVLEVRDFPKQRFVARRLDLPYSYGTFFHEQISHTHAIPASPSRERLVEDALGFVGLPYLWGGRSTLPGTSVDCSGLIGLLYRGQGILIPRDAHDQFLASHPTENPLPGDLLYLAKEKRINHVLMKIDHSLFLEAPETGKHVRLLAWGEHLWEREGKIHIYDRPHPYHFAFRKVI